MSTASASRAMLTGSYSFEPNEAVTVPVPGIPEARRVILISELLEKVAELSKRVVTLEQRNERAFAETARHRRKMVKERQAHPLDRRNLSAGVLPAETGEEDLLTMSNPDLEDESLRDAVAAADCDHSRDATAD
jgi:hypothetical protein